MLAKQRSRGGGGGQPYQRDGGPNGLLVADKQEILDDICKNIEMVVNTRAPILWDYFLRPQTYWINQSLLNYGINDFCLISEMDVENESDFVEALVETINRHEPRILVKDVVLEPQGAVTVIPIRIIGTFRRKPFHELNLETRLDVGPQWFSEFDQSNKKKRG